MNKYDITILVNSCDKYEDAWHPFFKLLSIQWKDCPYRIILITENKTFKCDYLNVETICCGKIPWGERLKKGLLEAKTEYVLYFLEDFFLKSPVDIETFNKALKIMTEDKSIGYMSLKYNDRYTLKDGTEGFSKELFWNKDELNTLHRVNNMSALWRRCWFLKLLRTYETPWEFDNYATIRSRRYKYKCLLINGQVSKPVFDYGVQYEYGYGISGGKWLPKNKELFEKYGIEVDFERLGFLELDENYKRIENNTQKKHNFIKVFLSKTKKKLRKFRSLYLPW